VGWARSNRVDSVAVIEQLPGGKARSGAVQELIVDWAGNEPEKAAAWVAGRPDSIESQFAIRNLANVWGRQDPASAEAWLALQPPSKIRDVGWQQLAQLRVGFDPLASLGMSAQITDEARRHKMTAIALEGLLWQNTAAAE